MEYLFIAIAPKFTLIRSGSTWKGPIFRSNGKNYLQTNDWYSIMTYIEILETI